MAQKSMLSNWRIIVVLAACCIFLLGCLAVVDVVTNCMELRRGGEHGRTDEPCQWAAIDDDCVLHTHNHSGFTCNGWRRLEDIEPYEYDCLCGQCVTVSDAEAIRRKIGEK